MSAVARHALRCAIAELRAAGVRDAAISAKYLLAASVGRATLPVADEILRGSRRFDADAKAQFADLLRRRVRREPLQYILGSWDFDVLQDLRVRAPVLIPRPETEELVSLVSGYVAAALEQRRAVGAVKHPYAFLEVGPGSGAVCVSLLARHPEIVGTAIDISEEAVALTRENAAAQGVADRLVVLRGDATTYAPAEEHILRTTPPTVGADTGGGGDAAAGGGGSGSGGGGSGAPSSYKWPYPSLARKQAPGFDMLVANPPYIPAAEYDYCGEEQEDDGALQPEVKRWEDKRALAGGDPAGLGFTLAMLAAAARGKWLRATAPILMETHSLHPFLLASYLGSSLPIDVTPAHAGGAAVGTIEEGGDASDAGDGGDGGDAASPGAGRRSSRSPAAAVARALETPPDDRDEPWAVAAAGLTHDAWAALKGDATGEAIRSAFHFVSAHTDFSGRPRFVHLRTRDAELRDTVEDVGWGLAWGAVLSVLG